jgi:hypothetical protein
MFGYQPVSRLLVIRQKEVVMFRSSKLLRTGFIAICIIALAFGFTFWSWSFTTSRINSAQSIGVFPSPSEGMLTLVRSGWTGIQKARIVHAKPETALGGSGMSFPACGPNHGQTVHPWVLLLMTLMLQEAISWIHMKDGF